MTWIAIVGMVVTVAAAWMSGYGLAMWRHYGEMAEVYASLADQHRRNAAFLRQVQSENQWVQAKVVEAWEEAHSGENDEYPPLMADRIRRSEQ